MSVRPSVADILAEHVVFEVECIDRMYLNCYVPRLMYAGGITGFFRQRGHRFASSSLMAPITDGFVTAVRRFAQREEVPLVAFKPQQRKDDVAQRFLAAWPAGAEGVAFIGRAQEKTTVWRTTKRHNPETGASYAWLITDSAMVNHYYFYCVDADFGPFFIKFGSYFPYTAKLCLNGHHWAQRQADAAGIGYEPLDNGFAGCDDPAGLQAVCDRLEDAAIDGLLRKWLAVLPHPFSAEDRAAGYRYELSVLQAEFALTQVLDRPVWGRMFFEEVIRDNLDLGRPDRVSLTFSRRVTRRTPGTFRTRVITDGVVPSLHVDYKHSKIKQYHKHGRALRTETTINDTRDFDLGRRLPNLPALRAVGFQANRRLLDVECLSYDPWLGERAWAYLSRPVIVDGQRAPALRIDKPHVQALLATLVALAVLPLGFANRDLRDRLAHLLGAAPGTPTPGQMSYWLRQLRLHGLIRRIPASHRYRVTDFGLGAALFLTRLHTRFIRPGLAQTLGPDPPSRSSKLGRAMRDFNAAVDDLAARSRLAA